MLCLATLIFFVFNTGDQVNQSVMAQNAADASALAGANWLAHGYNVLAANNVTSSRIIGLIAVLEAVSPSVEVSIPNAEKIIPVIDDYPNRLPGRGNASHPDAILSRALIGPINPGDCEGMDDLEHCEPLATEARNCLAKLREIQTLWADLNRQYQDRGGFPKALTRFDDGDLWQVLRGLQSFSDAVAEITPGMSQRRAYEVGRGNYSNSERMTFAALLPIMPDFPVRRGVWTDYHDPVMSGLPPDWQTTTAEIVKGGYHTMLDRFGGGYWPPYERRAARTVGSQIGRETEEEGEDSDERRRDPNQRRTWIPDSILNWVDANHTRDWILGNSKGPYRVYRDDVARWWGSWREMRLSGFPIIFERVSDAAMQAIWNDVVRSVPLPRWETDYVEITRRPGPQDAGGLLARGVNCAMSAWLGTRRNGREAFTDGENGTPSGTPWRIDDWPHPPKNEHIARGWFDHSKENYQDKWIWWGQNRLRTFEPEKFGATRNQFPPDGYEPPDANSNGQPAGQPYWLFWRWRKWMFLGSLFDTDSLAMPDLQHLAGDKSYYAPYGLDITGQFTERYRFGTFEVMAYAYRPGRARVWSRPLPNPTPLTAPDRDGRLHPVNLAYAQARVFNPTGWDLWTQNWRVKLVPATHLLNASAAVSRAAADLERFHAFDPAIEADQLLPIAQLYERMPADGGVLEEVANH